MSLLQMSLLPGYTSVHTAVSLYLILKIQDNEVLQITWYWNVFRSSHNTSLLWVTYFFFKLRMKNRRNCGKEYKQ